MKTIKRVSFAVPALCAAVFTFSSALAAPVTITATTFGSGGGVDLAGARAAQLAFHAGATSSVLENFESFSTGGVGASLSTAVGSFSSIGPNGCGGSCAAPSDQLHVRTGSVFGRFNTTLGGTKFLDSNDNSGILWNVGGLGAFDRLSFFAVDINDVSTNTFFVTIGGVTQAINFVGFTGFTPQRPNGELLLFTFLFDGLVGDATIGLNIRREDGFSLDDIRLSAVAVPEPQTLALALLALGGIVAARGRRGRGVGASAA